jgi:hypothetical protein
MSIHFGRILGGFDHLQPILSRKSRIEHDGLHCARERIASEAGEKRQRDAVIGRQRDIVSAALENVQLRCVNRLEVA